jgi:predicted ATPase
MTTPRDETAFFGRSGELAEIDARFAKGARLVTIVGLGGIGKTRLAIEATVRSKRWKEIVFVDVTGARGLEAAVRAVGEAAKVRVRAESKAGAAIAALGDALAERGAILVVLDGAETLEGDARELAAGLLDRARELAILATSREVLGVKGEEKILLPPLGDDDARALFLDRARIAAGKAIAVDPGELASIVERVDNLPLAIELAASRLEVLTPEELLARLGARLDVLADHVGRTNHPRQSTMRATLDASWDLLSHDEREILAQAAVFAAPFGIEVAEEILQIPSPGRPPGLVPTSTWGPEAPEVLDVIESLLRKSLLVRAEGSSGGRAQRAGEGRARLRMYETVRAWARGKLAATGAEDEVRARHAQYHLAEAEKLAAQTYGSGAVAALDGLTALLPELLAAFDHTRTADAPVAARIVLALTDLLLFRGLFELRAELFAAGAEAAERAGDERLLARSLVAKARVTLELGNMADAETELRRALALATKAKDATTIAEATRSLGWLLTATSRLDDAEQTLASALAMHVEQGSARGEADARVATAILRAFQGRRDDALAGLKDALAIHVETGDVIRQEKVLGFAALVGFDAALVARGLPREVLARAPASSIDMLPKHVADAVATQREAGQRWREAIELYARGVAAHERGAASEAVLSFEKALAALAKAGVTRGVAAIVAHAAAALAEAGDSAEADARIAQARKIAASDPGSELAVEVFAAAATASRADATREQRAAAHAMEERAARAEGATPELAVARRALARALASLEGSGPPSLAPATVRGGLVVGRDARWMIPPSGERVDLVRYGPVRRLLDRLVAERLERPGEALSADALIEAGWPNERMRHTAGLLRVYSAIRRLRRLGLEPVLVTRDDGYLLDANASVSRADS